MYEDTIAILMGNALTVETFTASTTSAQGNGVIGYGFTRVSTVTSDDHALTLPPAVAHADCIVLNADNTNHAKLWPSSGDKIDGAAADAEIRLWAGQVRWLKAVDDTDWYTVIKTPGHNAAVTAFATGGQANATLLEADVNRISTVGTNGDSVKLPPATMGLERWVINDDSAQSCDIFPDGPGLSDRINDQAVDTALSLSPNTAVVFKCMGTNLWNTW